MDTIGKLLGDFAHAHPNVVAGGMILVVIAVVITNAIRMTWPVFSEMPRWARFILGLFDPLAANFWNIARKADPEVSGPLKKTIGEPSGQ